MESMDKTCGVHVQDMLPSLTMRNNSATARGDTPQSCIVPSMVKVLPEPVFRKQVNENNVFPSNDRDRVYNVGGKLIKQFNVVN